jgi:hypothetical protein
MDPGDVLSSTIATVSLLATAILAYRHTRLQARLTAIEQTRQRQQLEASRHADVKAMVAGTPTALQLVLANDGSDDPPLFHGLDELEQAPATLRPGDRLPFPVLTLAETAERVQVVVSWKDEAGPTASHSRCSCRSHTSYLSLEFRTFAGGVERRCGMWRCSVGR